MTPSKARRVTQLQQEMLLQFMQDNPEFAARRATTPLNRALYDQKWEELAITLNGGGEGSQKSVAEWRKTWSDWRKNVRLKASGAKDGDSKMGEGARKLSCTERRLLELVGAGTPPKHTSVSTIAPITVTSTMAGTPRPAVSYALPHSVLPTQVPVSTNFASSSTTLYPTTTAMCDDDVEVLEDIESDQDSSQAPVSNSKDGFQSEPASPQQVPFPRQSTPESKRVGVGAGVGVASGLELRGSAGGAGVWRVSSLEERRLALEERRLQLDERRLKLEERRLKHEEKKGAMDRESHDIDMEMKRTLLSHMRRSEQNC